MGEAPTTTADDDEKKTKKKTKEEEEKSDDDDDDSDDSEEEEEEENRAPIKISNLDDLNAIKRAYEEMFCDGLLHTEKVRNALGFKHENLHRERGVRIRVCRAVIPGIFEEERWIRREVSRGSFATFDVSMRVWVRDYERDFDRVHSVLRTRGFALGGVLRRRRRGRRRGRETRRG